MLQNGLGSRYDIKFWQILLPYYETIEAISRHKILRKQTIYYFVWCYKYNPFFYQKFLYSWNMSSTKDGRFLIYQKFHFRDEKRLNSSINLQIFQLTLHGLIFPDVVISGWHFNGTFLANDPIRLEVIFVEIVACRLNVATHMWL